MNRTALCRAILALLALALPLKLLSAASAQQPSPTAAPAAQLGEIEFPNSGSPAAQEPFLRGLALLHSFEYGDAAEAFREAQRLDPDFAMAYWGEAMTYNHPIWMQQDSAAARQALARLEPTSEARAAKARTERERDYLAALDVLYTEGPKEARDSAYARAMEALAAKYPDDPDAAAFHALALLGTSHHGRDIPTYMRAAAVVEEVFRDHPRHPGAVHYLIHSYDDPIHAPLGLRAARAYSTIAPAAAHAQHMTSHIFVARGMWDDVVEANETAAAVLNRQREARGEAPTWCGHYPIWLHYGYLQQGRHADARRILDTCHDEAVSTESAGAMRSFVGMRARHLLDTEDWSSDVLELTAPMGEGLDPRYTYDFTTAFAALRRGDTATARPIIDRMAEARKEFVAETATDQGRNASRLGATEVLEQELRALLMLAEGKKDEAVNRLRQATATEESLPYEFGPPFIEKPSHELLGEVLLELDRPAEAAAAFEAALRRTPQRTQALTGLLRAAEETGDTPTAERARMSLRTIQERAKAASESH